MLVHLSENYTTTDHSIDSSEELELEDISVHEVGCRKRHDDLDDSHSGDEGRAGLEPQVPEDKQDGANREGHVEIDDEQELISKKIYKQKQKNTKVN